MKKILLVAPLPLRFDLTQDNFYRSLPFSKVKSLYMPLHLATIAGLTPEGYQVDIWDESVQGRVEEKSDAGEYDLVGITGYTVHMPRAVEISSYFRGLGKLVVMGGAGVSSLPQRFYNDFDALFIGEAELTWPMFLENWQAGNINHVYRQVAPVDLANAPLPRWDSISKLLPYYLLAGVQTSRGCPFNCDFCDVSLLFGRRFRHKPVGNVIEELRVLEKLGARRVVFCDDNFAGNPSYTKELLREVISFNGSLRQPLGFATEASINIASDEELLELLADANFVEVFVGIESPNKESLKEANKLHNFNRNLIADIKKIQSYGLAVRGSLIVGFDHDDTTIFDTQFQFVQDSLLSVPNIRVLTATPGTRLWKRMRKEGRVLKTDKEGRFYGNPGTTNIIPRKMSRTDLLQGYLGLLERVHDWHNFAIRLKGFVSGVTRHPQIPNQVRHYKRVLLFVCFLFMRVEPKNWPVIIDILWHTLRNAPFLLPRITGTILRQYGYATRPKMHEAIRELIAHENAGKARSEIEKDEDLLPVTFLEIYESLFPDIYARVYNGLAHKKKVEEAVIEIFVDYLQHHQPSSDLQQSELLHEISILADEVVARKNAYSDSSAGKTEENIPDWRKYGLDDRVLKAIEQELLISAVRG